MTCYWLIHVWITHEMMTHVPFLPPPHMIIPLQPFRCDLHHHSCHFTDPLMLISNLPFVCFSGLSLLLMSALPLFCISLVSFTPIFLSHNTRSATLLPSCFFYFPPCCISPCPILPPPPFSSTIVPST